MFSWLSATDTIGRFGTLRDAADETAFREARLSRQARTARTVIAMLLLSNLLLVNDYRIFGTTAAFWMLLKARIAFTVLSVVVWSMLVRPRSVRAANALVFLWIMALVVLTRYVASTRPAESNGDLVATVGVVLICYVAVPLPLTAQLAAAISASLASMLLLWRGATGPDALLVATLGITLVIGNVVGAITAASLHAWRRQQYLALRAETELRRRLEQALAEIRKLEGMLPICSYCRRLRSEEGDWQPVEVFLKAHTDASFTHGICPDCLHDHFPDDVKSATNT